MFYAAFRRVLSLLTIIVFTYSLCLHAEEPRGRVVRTAGDVFVIDADGDRRGIDEAGYVLSERDTLVTASGGRAVVLLSDGAMTVLDENSRLRLEKTGWLSHLGGRIYYTCLLYTSDAADDL